VTEPRLHCRRARETLSAALDGEASEAEVSAAVTHLRLCVDCLDFVVSVVTTTQALRDARGRPTRAITYARQNHVIAVVVLDHGEEAPALPSTTRAATTIAVNAASCAAAVHSVPTGIVARAAPPATSRAALVSRPSVRQNPTLHQRKMATPSASSIPIQPPMSS
jgi:hypothetical protein